MFLLVGVYDVSKEVQEVTGRWATAQPSEGGLETHADYILSNESVIKGTPTAETAHTPTAQDSNEWIVISILVYLYQVGYFSPNSEFSNDKTHNQCSPKEWNHTNNDQAFY